MSVLLIGNAAGRKGNVTRLATWNDVGQGGPTNP
jgi:hypothetical protein